MLLLERWGLSSGDRDGSALIFDLDSHVPVIRTTVSCIPWSLSNHIDDNFFNPTLGHEVTRVLASLP